MFNDHLPHAPFPEKNRGYKPKHLFNLNLKILGVLGLIGAPFLLLGSRLAQWFPALEGAWFYGVWGFIYISAWMCSIQGLRLLEATGKSLFGKLILHIITTTLILANVSNVYAFLFPNDQSGFFFFLDAFWPISNLVMLVVGITVVAAKGLPGWRRYVPLLVGLWFPSSMGLLWLVGNDSPWMSVGEYYSAIAWSLLAIVVITTEKNRPVVA
jgi:hypothetical protein